MPISNPVKKPARRPGMVGKVSISRSKNMASIKTKNTGPELLLQKHLSLLGLKYSLHSTVLPGQPDIVFFKAKTAIFCDGDFWHGRNWKKRKAAGEFKVRNKFWVHKIEENIARDRRNNRKLKKMGWTVIRIWNNELKQNPEKISEKIKLKVAKNLFDQ